MKKQYFLLCFLICATINAHSQQLVNVLLTTNGKATYKIAAGKSVILLSDQGKIQTIDADASGEIVFNKNLFPQQIGELGLGFNYEGWLSKIGDVTIMYDYTGRVDRVGNLVFRYNYNQQIGSIGGYTITYNSNKTIDQIGQYKIYYNYSGNVFRIDQSKGLILLQLNFSK
ncbi:MAG: hypothetical protein B7Y37_00520 [Sphingobacteriia bacterium 28-36-52]|nr:MAG: hypothetical protein B7Y37_00520 [Sphingobacteriia bacterium 28-36-52]